MRMSYKPGRKVRIAEGSGLLSGTIATIIQAREGRTDSRGVPQIHGHYKPIDSSEVWLRLEDGSLATMFKRRLFAID